MKVIWVIMGVLIISHMQVKAEGPPSNGDAVAWCDSNEDACAAWCENNLDEDICQEPECD